ncbi:Hpt domain-containing protein [Lentisphaerota bacterium ZTH]|nr:Hpt domain-containing protein [Lentisphaerota bacterium]WET05673.1 Hpt domain-containing protein [Lentisphaerota bacterium ZTH]
MSDTKKNIFEYMRKNLGFSEVDSEDIFKTFLECADDYLKQAKTHLSNEAWEQLARLGHTIKGAAASIGACHISQTGKELQSAAEKKSAELVLEKITILENIVKGL